MHFVSLVEHSTFRILHFILQYETMVSFEYNVQILDILEYDQQQRRHSSAHTLHINLIEIDAQHLQ